MRNILSVWRNLEKNYLRKDFPESPSVSASETLEKFLKTIFIALSSFILGWYLSEPRPTFFFFFLILFLFSLWLKRSFMLSVIEVFCQVYGCFFFSWLQGLPLKISLLKLPSSFRSHFNSWRLWEQQVGLSHQCAKDLQGFDCLLGCCIFIHYFSQARLKGILWKKIPTLKKK